MTGITDCCARAASGNAAIVPPRNVINVRRSIRTPKGTMNLKLVNIAIGDGATVDKRLANGS
jgi:hypothetical protein